MGNWLSNRLVQTDNCMLMKWSHSRGNELTDGGKLGPVILLSGILIDGGRFETNKGCVRVRIISAMCELVDIRLQLWKVSSGISIRHVFVSRSELPQFGYKLHLFPRGFVDTGQLRADTDSNILRPTVYKI